MLRKKFKYILLVFLFCNNLVYANIGGIVFEEFPMNNSALNTYGEKDSNEIGVQGVTVTAYLTGESNSTIKSTKTLANGQWNLDVSGDARVEFSDWPTYLKESPAGKNFNSSVLFAEQGNLNVNFGLYNINNFTTNLNPKYVTNIITNGSGIDSSIPAIVSNNYLDTGLNSDFKDGLGINGEGNKSTTDLNTSSIGTVWGKGYQTSKKRMFISSVLWRHSGFSAGNPGRIYVLDYNNSPANLLGSFDLEGLGVVDRNSSPFHTLDKDSTEPNVDFDAYSKIGKISYGDLDFDNNTQKIWTINLNEKKIISLDASSLNIDDIASSVKSYSITESLPTCIGGEIRPWALGLRNGKGYIGTICDASTSQNSGDLKAYVSEFNLTNPSKLKTLLSIDMDYDRKTLADGVQGLQTFQPWSDKRHDALLNLDYYNQPILSDIDFDIKGNMYLAFLDRFALQIGHNNYANILGSKLILEKVQGFGEIFKVCNNDGNFSLEGTESCLSTNSRNGDIDFFDDKGGDTNANPIGGALAILPGSNQLLATIGDPHPTNSYGQAYWATNGVQTFNLADGEIDNWYAHLNSSNSQYTGKGIGMGDIELLNTAAPFEIGDRVWIDNKNGIQDASEKGLANILIQLLKDGKVISEVKTNTQGYYIFSSNEISELTLNDNYTIRIPDINGSKQQEGLVGYTLTSNHQGEGVNSHLNDSDGIVIQNSNHAEITVSTVDISYGENDHSLDFGFYPNTIVADVNHDNNTCTCHPYKEKSVSLDNIFNLLILLILPFLIHFYFLHKKSL